MGELQYRIETWFDVIGCVWHHWQCVSPFFLCLCSEDSCEDPMSSGEECLSSSLGSDAEGPYFPLHLHRQKHRQHLHAWRRHVPCRLHPLVSPSLNLLFLIKLRCWWRIAQQTGSCSVWTLPVRFFFVLVSWCVGACWDVTFQVLRIFKRCGLKTKTIGRLCCHVLTVLIQQDTAVRLDKQKK